MKIVATRCRPFTDFGGMEKWSLALSKALSLNDKTLFVTGDGVYSIYNKKIEKISHFTFKNTIRAILKVNILTYQILKQNKQIDSVHIFGHVGIISLYLIKSIKNSSFYGLGYECVFDRDEGIKKRIKNVFHRFLMKITVKKIDRLYVLEKSRMNEIASFFKISNSRVRTIENFIDNQEISHQPNYKINQEKIVLSIGRDCAAKQRKLLIDDWISLYGDKKEYKLIIISKNLNQKLLKVVSKIDNIDYYNDISDSELINIRKKASFDISYSNQRNPLLVSLESISYGCIPIVNENNETSYFNKDNSISLKCLETISEEKAKNIFDYCYEGLKKRTLKAFERTVLNENI